MFQILSRCLTRAVLVAALTGWLSSQVGPPARADGLWEREWPRTDFSRRTVVLNEIQSGGPPKDGIPAIDQPAFGSVGQASAWLDPAEPVIVLERSGRARAYPLQILIWHEIVNDDFAGLARISHQDSESWAPLAKQIGRSPAEP